MSRHRTENSKSLETCAAEFLDFGEDSAVSATKTKGTCVWREYVREKNDIRLLIKTVEENARGGERSFR